WSCRQSYWDHQFDYFTDTHAVVRLDLAGHGRSRGERTTWSMSAFGMDVVSVLDHLKLRETILIGHSMGGAVIVEAAQQLSNRIVGLIGVETWGHLGRPRTRQAVSESLEPFRFDFACATRAAVQDMFTRSADSALVARVVSEMSSMPSDSAVAALQAYRGYDSDLRFGFRKCLAREVGINSRMLSTHDTTARD